MHAAVCLFLFLVTQDRKLSLSGCLGWAEGASKLHARNNKGDAAIYNKYYIYSIERILCFFARLLGFRNGWPIEQAEKLGLRPPCFFFRRHCPGYDVIWSVGVGAAIAPSPLDELRVLSSRSWSPGVDNPP